MNIPGLEETIVKKVHRCPACGERTKRVHDYRTQKMQHRYVF
ncbi:transposase family protein [Alteribacillus persepolensis]